MLWSRRAAQVRAAAQLAMHKFRPKQRLLPPPVDHFLVLCLAPLDALFRRDSSVLTINKNRQEAGERIAGAGGVCDTTLTFGMKPKFQDTQVHRADKCRTFRTHPIIIGHLLMSVSRSRLDTQHKHSVEEKRCTTLNNIDCGRGCMCLHKNTHGFDRNGASTRFSTQGQFNTPGKTPHQDAF